MAERYDGNPALRPAHLRACGAPPGGNPGGVYRGRRPSLAQSQPAFGRPPRLATVAVTGPGPARGQDSLSGPSLPVRGSRRAALSAALLERRPLRSGGDRRHGPALDQLKARQGASALVLVGYSGGGAVAALLAARRSDVTRLVTIAGNLNLRAWTAYHRLTPLDASLNAADQAERLAATPQIHRIGGRDTVMPAALAHRWPAALLGPRQENLKLVPEANHGQGWPDPHQEFPLGAPGATASPALRTATSPTLCPLLLLPYLPPRPGDNADSPFRAARLPSRR